MDYQKINDEFYNRNFWRVDRSEEKWFSKYVKVKILKKMIKNIKKGVIYDAGGGVGNYGWYFGRDFKKTIVSDISQVALNQIPEKNIIRLKCSVLDNKLPDSYADCILLIDVFEHINKTDLPRMMKDLKRVLKPDGRILMFTSHYGYVFGAIPQRLFNLNRRLLGNESSEGHVNRLTFREFKHLFKESGLIIDDYYFYSVFFQQITDLIKDSFSRFASVVLKRQKNDENMGRKGQSIKEDLKKKEKSPLLRIPLLISSYLSYSDVLLFGKIPLGNSVFFSLRKENTIKL